MLEIKLEKSFKKDIERDKTSGKYSKSDFDILKEIIQSLQNQEEINAKYTKHHLTGNMKDFECIHIKNDWLLIFKSDDNFLTFVMLGKHTQVYKKFK